MRAVASLRIAVENADAAPDVAVSYVRVLHAALETLGAHVAAAMTWPLIGRPDTAALGRIEEPLRQELAAIRCIVVPPPRAGLLEPDEAPFGLEVAADFQSTGYDIEEASTCLALRRPTASVFHCMRVLESGISICARRAKVVDPLTAPERDWQTILRRLQGGADTGAAAALRRWIRCAGGGGRPGWCSLTDTRKRELSRSSEPCAGSCARCAEFGFMNCRSRAL